MDKIKINEGESVLVGYGSLLSKTSLEKTLGRTYDNHYLSAKIFGYKRVWNVFTPNDETESGFYFQMDTIKIRPKKVIYLNVASDSTNDTLNVCLFIVNDKEMAAFDKREWVYHRVDVKENVFSNPFEDEIPIWMYVANDSYIIDSISNPQEMIIRQSYIDIVESGLKDWGDDFREDFWKSTDKPKQNIVVYDFWE